jgi:chemotaxis methyl-accepting protein methylase
MEAQVLRTEILPENYRFLQQHVYSQVGIVLEENKHYLFESRLAPIVKQFRLGSINDLCDLLLAKRNPEIGHQVVEAMTTNETYFFRDPAQYDAIRTALLVGCVFHGTGSLQPRHVAKGSGLAELGHSNSRYRLLL